MALNFIGVTLPIRKGQTGMFEQSTETVQQIRSNFKNLLLTKKGERLYQPELGCDLWRVLFEPMTPDTAETARLSVTDAVDRWLPFLEVVELNITATVEDKIIGITCTYRYRSNPNVFDTITFTGTELGLPNVVANTTPPIQYTSNNSAVRLRRI